MKKFIWHLIACLIIGPLGAFIYLFFGVGFSTIKAEIQWILLPVITLLREIIKWVYEKLSYKTAGKDGKDKLFSIQFAMYHLAEARHAVFVAMIVGGSATPETTYSIIGIDFLINIINCCKIIRKYRRGIEGT